MASERTPPKDTGEDPSAVVKPKTAGASKKRYPTVRTTIRHLLDRATFQAIGRLGDTKDGANKRAVGTAHLEIETRPHGHDAEHPVKKHVHVQVVMAVTDHEDCACIDPKPPVPTPPAPPSPVKQFKQWAWWLIVPILGGALLMPPYPEQQKQPTQPAPVTGTTTPGSPGVTPAPAPVTAQPVTPAPVKPAPAPADPTQVPPVTLPGDAGDLGSGAGLPSAPPPSIGCNGLTGQLATAPDYTAMHTTPWVKAHADSWFVKRLPQCGATVQAFDINQRSINVQDYGANMVYLGQRVYVYSHDQIQIDSFDQLDRFVGRTIYRYDGAQTRRVSLAFRFDAHKHLIYEARINRDSDASIASITLWTFAADGQVCSQKTYTAQGQISANLRRYFFQFPEFDSGSW